MENASPSECFRAMPMSFVRGILNIETDMLLMANGMPVLFRCAVKPTPTIRKEQQTVDITKNCETTLAAGGRHDPAIVHRARVVADCMTAIVLYDMLVTRFGPEWPGGAD